MFLPAVQFCTGVSSRMKPPLGGISSGNMSVARNLTSSEKLLDKRVETLCLCGCAGCRRGRVGVVSHVHKHRVVFCYGICWSPNPVQGQIKHPALYLAGHSPCFSLCRSDCASAVSRHPSAF